MNNQKYILEISYEEASKLFHYIPDKDPETKHVKDTLRKILSDKRPSTLLSTIPTDPVPNPHNNIAIPIRK